jgi:hypothetical protein
MKRKDVSEKKKSIGGKRYLLGGRLEFRDKE